MKSTLKQLVAFILAAVTFLACNNSKQAVKSLPVNLYETIPDSAEKKSLVGILSKEQITKDTAFAWYQENLKYYHLDSATVQAIRNKKDKIHLVLFMGTWCHDSQQLVPKYFETLQAANVSDQRLTIIGTDRKKKTIGELHNVFLLESVPTMIVMQDGKEIGRIVEYGNTTFVDKELGELMLKVQ